MSIVLLAIKQRCGNTDCLRYFLYFPPLKCRSRLWTEMQDCSETPRAVTRIVCFPSLKCREAATCISVIQIQNIFEGQFNGKGVILAFKHEKKQQKTKALSGACFGLHVFCVDVIDKKNNYIAVFTNLHTTRKENSPRVNTQKWLTSVPTSFMCLFCFIFRQTTYDIVVRK